MRNSSAYCQYNSHLPRWLHNRPRQFITHCCQRLTHAQSITKKTSLKKEMASSLLKAKVTIKFHTKCTLVIAATCLPALVLTGKDITGHASILWLSTNIFQNGDGKQCLLTTVQAPISRLIRM